MNKSKDINKPKSNLEPSCKPDIIIEIPEGDNRPRSICKNCGKIFYENPKVVSGCLLVWENKILMCRRAIEPREGRWTLPAGFLENSETVSEGALRETFEEAGATSDKINLFFMCDLPHISQIYMMYVGKLKEGKFSAGIESHEVKLFSIDEIPWNDLAFEVIERTLKLYIDDNKKGTIGLHFDKIDKRDE